MIQHQRRVIQKLERVIQRRKVVIQKLDIFQTDQIRVEFLSVKARLLKKLLKLELN